MYFKSCNQIPLTPKTNTYQFSHYKILIVLPDKEIELCFDLYWLMSDMWGPGLDYKIDFIAFEALVL